MSQPTAVVAAKNPGVAFILGLIWPGVGHIYAGKTLTGLLWMLVALGLVALGVTIIGLIIAVPAWLAIAGFGQAAAKQSNRQNGIG